MIKRVVNAVPRVVVATALACLAAGCTGKPAVVGPDAARNVPVLVVSHGWHTGLIVPSGPIDARIADLRQRFGNAPPAHYEIGWGDKGFYQAPDVTSGLVLRALFRSTGAILHVVAVPERDPRTAFAASEVVETCLTPSQIGALADFVAASFARDDAGDVVRLDHGLYGESQFYDAVGRYSMLETCNKWTARALAHAGVDMSPAWKLAAGSVMRAMRSRTQACAPQLPTAARGEAP